MTALLLALCVLAFFILGAFCLVRKQNKRRQSQATQEANEELIKALPRIERYMQQYENAPRY